MKKLLWFLLVLTTFDSYSQKQNPSNDILESTLRKNNFKICAPGLFVKNYSLSLERLISRKISLQISYRNGAYGYWIDNPIGKKIVKGGLVDPRYYGFQIGNNAITADIRFYMGKKEGMQGLFAGLYGRYAVFDADNVDFNYVTKPEKIYSVPLVNNFSGIGGGIIIGRQWVVKKRISIEYITGIQYGKISGSLTSDKDLSGLSETEKNVLKENVTEIFTIFKKNYVTDLTVNDKGLNGKISGPFIGLRSALTIGFLF